jgi:hypothetical protein
MAGTDGKTPARSAAEATAAGATPREDEIVRNFRDVAFSVLGEPREINAVWSSIDASNHLSEEAHLIIKPAFEMAPKTAEFSAIVIPAKEDATESLSLGAVRSPNNLPQFPVVPEKLGFAELAQLNPDDLAERRKIEQTVLKQGVKYLIAIPQLFHMPDAQVLDITKGSVKNPPEETLHSSPTEVVATISINQFDTRTVRAHVEMDGSVDLCVTDMVDGKETERGGIEALADAKTAVESFFPGFFPAKEPQKTPQS